jgi:hypothetical protein
MSSAPFHSVQHRRHRQRTCPSFIFTSPNDYDHFDQLTFDVQAIVYQMP